MDLDAQNWAIVVFQQSVILFDTPAVPSQALTKLDGKKSVQRSLKIFKCLS